MRRFKPTSYFDGLSEELDLQTSMPIMSEPTRMAPPDLDVQKDEDEEVTSIPVMQEECPHHF